MTAATVVLILVTCAAAAIDIRTRRIPNALTGAAALAAVAVHLPAGPAAVALSLATMLAAFVVGSIAFSAGWIGGGDVKLVAVSCGLAGGAGAVWLVLDILVAGALLACIAAAARGRLTALLRSTAAVAAYGVPLETNNTLPYAAAIAAGSIAYVALTTIPALRFPQ